MTTQPVKLDAPDGPGWWAFEGKNAFNRQVQTVLQIIEWREPLIDDDGVEIEVYRMAGDRYPTIYNADHFRQKYNGKWYRVHLPWESPPAQTPAMPQADWSSAPTWAMFWAVDKDGEQAYWYDTEPPTERGFWGYTRLLEFDRVVDLNGCDWKETLQARPGQEDGNDG